MKVKLLALLMGTSLVLAACGAANDNSTDKGSGKATSTADAGDVAKLYKNKCSACHGQDLTGGVGPNLTKVGAEFSKEEIAHIIKNGKGVMPSGLLDESQTAQMAEWLAKKK